MIQISNMKIYVIAFNREDFIEIQYKLSTLNNSTLVIINNGSNENITRICEKLNIECHNIQNKGFNSVSHGNALNYLKTIIDYDKPYCILDHDFFIFRDLIDLPYDIISMKIIPRDGFYHLWPGLIICRGGINLSNIDFTPNKLGDTGCNTNHIAMNYNMGWITEEYIGSVQNDSPQNSKLISKFLIDGKPFGLHFINGSGWAGEITNTYKKEMLLYFLEDYIKTN